MVSVTNRFPLWGDVGEEPQDGFLYEGGDQVNKKHLNYLWDKIQKQTDDFITKTDDLQAQITAIDANGDGIVDAADTANLYKGNDIDTDGDGVVNEADEAGNAQTLQGLQPDDLRRGITSTQHVTTFEEPYVSIDGYDTVIDGSIDSNSLYVISTATFSTSFDISGQDTSPQGMAWNDTGSKMYMVGNSNDNIYEYNVSTPYDVSTATFSTSFDVSGQDISPSGMAWNDTGSKMYIVGYNSDSVHEYNVSTPYDISTATFSTSFFVGAQDDTPFGITWNNTGSKMYIVGGTNNSIYEYNVSTPYDVSTATFSTSFDVSGQDNNPQGMAWNNTGSKMYIVGYNSDSVHEYNVSTPYDVSTATFSTSFDVSGQDSVPLGMSWDGNGNKLYVVGGGNSSIYEYDVAVNNPTSIVTVDNPDDVFEWDIVTFESDPAVTVNLLDESGTTLLTDIGPNTDISAISSNENFKFEFVFDTSTSRPSVDYLARRFKGGDTSQVVPTGVITMWSGTTSDVPSGWTLCDGANGAPDLRDRFVAGAGGQYSAGETGGADSVALSESEMPSHDHTGSTNTTGGHNHGIPIGGVGGSGGGWISEAYDMDSISNYALKTNYSGNHSHNLNINNAGNDDAHENRPPFYALAYIMKI